MPIYRLSAVVLACCTLCGCAARDRSTDFAAVPAAARDVPALAAADVYPPGARTKRYIVRDDRGDDLGVETRVTSLPEPEGTWTVISTPRSPDGVARPPTETTLTREADGTVSARSVRTPRDADGDGAPTLFVYEPPLLLCPPVVEPGVVYERTSEMTERDRRDSARVRGRGEATRRIRMATAEEMVSAFPDRPGAVGLVVLQEVRFGPAVDVRESVLRLEPGGAGLAEETTRRTLKVLGLQMKDESRRYRVVEDESGG